MSPRFALITGGARRIGAHFAQHLAQRGYHIGLHYHTAQEEAERCAQAIRQYGQRCMTLSADLQHPEGADILWQAFCAHFPHCDVLINNASIFKNNTFQNISYCALERDFSIHLFSPIYLIQQIAKQKREATVINMLDTRISRCDQDYVSYNLSKQALRHLTQVSAQALAPMVKVHAICPGAVLPPPGADTAQLQECAQKTPLQRIISLEALTQALDYLLDNLYISGEVLFVDGGQHLSAR